mgnify:CR=1 FL=1|jgi:ribosomal protein L18
MTKNEKSEKRMSDMLQRMNSLNDRLAVLESNFTRAQQLIQEDMKKLITMVANTGDTK